MHCVRYYSVWNRTLLGFSVKLTAHFFVVIAGSCPPTSSKIRSPPKMIPVVASNRFGTEILLDKSCNVQQQIKFYGRSFITDETGAIVKEAKDGSDIISSTVNVERNRATRASWGLFRDRRPELYTVLKTKDGSLAMP